MKTVKFFLLGVWEFRLTCTTHPGEHENAYDRGRELAHVLTFRRYEP
jgi:hypothetical protein